MRGGASQPLLTRWAADLAGGSADASAPSVPSTLIPESALDAVLRRAPVFLRSGVWPVNPLAAPELVRFCEWLPPAWRHGKRRLRARLARAGLPPHLVFPPLRESFAPVMAHGVQLYGRRLMDRLLRESILVDLGYVDGVALRRRLATPRAPSGVVGDGLYEVINMELGLRSLMGCQG